MTRPKRQLTGENGLEQLLRRWKLLAHAMAAHLCEMPYATAAYTAFDEALNNIESTRVEQHALEAQLAGLIARRRDHERRARHARNRLIAFLQGRYGRDSESLRAFGLEPRVHRPRGEEVTMAN